MASASMVPLNIVNALEKARDFLKSGNWEARSSLQTDFFRQFYHEKRNFHLFADKELRAWADTVAANLNRILAEEGFSLKFNEFGPNEFGVLSILDVSVQWIKEGKAFPGTGRFPFASVVMEDVVREAGKNIEPFNGFVTDAHQYPIARLLTKSNDLVYMTIAGEEKRGFELMERIDLLRAAPKKPAHFRNLIFPMIDFEETKSLDWLRGLSTLALDGQTYKIAAAAQETKFKMNHTGARVKDVVTLVARGISVPKQLVIDRPFYLWIERPGLGKPIFYSYLDEKVWKDPGSLEM